MLACGGGCRASGAQRRGDPLDQSRASKHDVMQRAAIVILGITFWRFQLHVLSARLFDQNPGGCDIPQRCVPLNSSIQPRRSAP